MSQESTLSTQRIYEGRILNLRLDTVHLPQGRVGKREIIEHGPSVVVVALNPERHILLVRQYRKAVEKTLLELPAGGIEQGEDPAAAALRELQEETGYVAGHLQALGGFYASPGYCGEFLHLFLATELHPGPQSPAEDETIEVVKVPMEHALNLIASGEICDAKSVAGILRAFIHLKN